MKQGEEQKRQLGVCQTKKKRKEETKKKKKRIYRKVKREQVLPELGNKQCW